jgi:hypothetical protein
MSEAPRVRRHRSHRLEEGAQGRDAKPARRRSHPSPENRSKTDERTLSARKSGNPDGRPRANHSIQELARQHAPEAIKTLADIAKKGTPSARVSAAVALLDRAYGKAPTFSTSDTQAFKRAIDMTDDELAAIISGARLTVVK